MENKFIQFNSWREEYRYALDMAYKQAMLAIDTAPLKMDIALVLKFPVCVRLSVGDEENGKQWEAIR